MYRLHTTSYDEGPEKVPAKPASKVTNCDHLPASTPSAPPFPARESGRPAAWRRRSPRRSPAGPPELQAQWRASTRPRNGAANNGRNDTVAASCGNRDQETCRRLQGGCSTAELRGRMSIFYNNNLRGGQSVSRVLVPYLVPI